MPFREMTRDQVWLLPPSLDELIPPTTQDLAIGVLSIIATVAIAVVFLSVCVAAA